MRNLLNRIELWAKHSKIQVPCGLVLFSTYQDTCELKARLPALKTTWTKHTGPLHLPPTAPGRQLCLARGGLREAWSTRRSFLIFLVHLRMEKLSSWGVPGGEGGKYGAIPTERPTAWLVLRTGDGGSSEHLRSQRLPAVQNGRCAPVHPPLHLQVQATHWCSDTMRAPCADPTCPGSGRRRCGEEASLALLPTYHWVDRFGI